MLFFCKKSVSAGRYKSKMISFLWKATILIYKNCGISRSFLRLSEKHCSVNILIQLTWLCYGVNKSFIRKSVQCISLNCKSTSRQSPQSFSAADVHHWLGLGYIWKVCFELQRDLIPLFLKQSARLSQEVAVITSALSLFQSDAPKTTWSALLAISMTIVLWLTAKMIQNSQLYHLILSRMAFARHVLADRRGQVVWENKHLNVSGKKKCLTHAFSN